MNLVNLKDKTLRLSDYENFKFVEIDITDKVLIKSKSGKYFIGEIGCSGTANLTSKKVDLYSIKYGVDPFLIIGEDLHNYTDFYNYEYITSINYIDNSSNINLKLTELRIAQEIATEFGYVVDSDKLNIILYNMSLNYDIETIKYVINNYSGYTLDKINAKINDTIKLL